MASKNLVILIGNVGQDPTIHTFNDGNKVANLSLATTERYKDRDGNLQENTTWHNVVVYGKTAEFVEKYIGKGRNVYIDGRLRVRKYEDSDGKTHMIYEVVAESVQPLDSQPKGSGSGWSQDLLRSKGKRLPSEPRVTGGKPQSQDLEPQSDDLPF